MIKDYKGGKSVVVIAGQSGTIAMALKNKSKAEEAVKAFASLKATRLTKIKEGPMETWRNF